MTAGLAVPAFYSFIPGVEGAPLSASDVPGGPAARTVGLPLPIDLPGGTSRQGFDAIRYPNPRPATGQLVDVHVARMGPDGRVWVDGNPDPAAPLRQRCPVLSCLQLKTDYPGHLCVQADGAEEWRDWPAATTPAAPDRRRTKC